VLYSEDDVNLLDWEQSCWDKEAIISSERVFDHILDMGIRSTWTGCSLGGQAPNDTPGAAGGGPVSVAAAVDGVAAAAAAPGARQLASSVVGSGVNLTCRGERRYDAPRKVAPMHSFLPARRYASADTSYGRVSVRVCLSQVCVLWKRLDESGWFLAWELPSTYPTLCYKEIQASSKIRYFPEFSLELCSKLWSTVYRSSKRVIYLARKRWTLRA